VRASAERDRALAAEKQADAEKASAQATLRFLLADVLEYAGGHPACRRAQPSAASVASSLCQRFFRVLGAICPSRVE
jgi:hypothetical protein